MKKKLSLGDGYTGEFVDLEGVIATVAVIHHMFEEDWMAAELVDREARVEEYLHTISGAMDMLIECAIQYPKMVHMMQVEVPDHLKVTRVHNPMYKGEAEEESTRVDSSTSGQIGEIPF